MFKLLLTPLLFFSFLFPNREGILVVNKTDVKIVKLNSGGYSGTIHVDKEVKEAYWTEISKDNWCVFVSLSDGTMREYFTLSQYYNIPKPIK